MGTTTAISAKEYEQIAKAAGPELPSEYYWGTYRRVVYNGNAFNLICSHDKQAHSIEGVDLQGRFKLVPQQIEWLLKETK